MGEQVWLAICPRPQDREIDKEVRALEGPQADAPHTLQDREIPKCLSPGARRSGHVSLALVVRLGYSKPRIASRPESCTPLTACTQGSAPQLLPSF